MGARQAGLVRAGFRRAGATTTGGGTITLVTSTGGSVIVTNPSGPTVNLEVNTSDIFPGYGGAPPSVASVSSAGAATTVSRSDHTHAGTSSVNGAAGAATFASAGATIAITGAAPALNFEVATPFPGYGAAPPSITSVSSAGAATTVSRSDHTHGQDLSVVYVPSLAAGQASGVFQQTYGAPNATPSVLTMTAGNIPFGGATGLLTQDPTLIASLTGSSGVLTSFAVTSSGSSVTPGAIPAQICAIAETTTFSARGFISALHATATATTGPLYITRRSRGTFAAPTTVVVGDIVGDYRAQAYNGASYSNAGRLDFFADLVTANTNVNSTLAINLVGTGASSIAAATCLLTSLHDIVINLSSVATNATNGYLWLPASAGAPVGVPSLAAYTPATPTPLTVDSTDQRWYANIGGAWHFATFMDYDPTATRIPFGGATAHTLTDNAAMTYTTASQTLTLTGTGGLTESPLVIAVGDVSGNAIHLTSGASTILSSSSYTARTVTGSTSWAPGGTITLQADVNGNVALGVQTALATNATAGFPYIRTQAGAATGVPTLPFAGSMAPFVYDTTNDAWRVYNPIGAAWKMIGTSQAIANGTTVVALGAFGPAGSSATPTRWKKESDGAGGFFTMPSYT